MYYHAIATLSGGRRKSVVNKTDSQMLTDYVIPFHLNGTIKEKWGQRRKSYQVLELRVYKTEATWNRRKTSLEDFLGRAKNIYASFAKRAEGIIRSSEYRVFIIMPIQGKESGSMDEQRIFGEYDARFVSIEDLLGEFSCVAIRIDKEYPIDQLVQRIKEEIRKAQFVIADLTDERPSCYFEAGYAEGLGIPIIYMASESSVIDPKEKTTIHFDIHMNVPRFTNHKEMTSYLHNAIEKNKGILFADRVALQSATEE